MNSDVSGMSFGASVTMDTPAGGGPACCGACDWPFDPHAEADSRTANIVAEAGADKLEAWWRNMSLILDVGRRAAGAERFDLKEKGHAENVAVRKP